MVSRIIVATNPTPEVSGAKRRTDLVANKFRDISISSMVPLFVPTFEPIDRHFTVVFSTHFTVVFCLSTVDHLM